MFFANSKTGTSAICSFDITGTKAALTIYAKGKDQARMVAAGAYEGPPFTEREVIRDWKA